LVNKDYQRKNSSDIEKKKTSYRGESKGRKSQSHTKRKEGEAETRG